MDSREPAASGASDARVLMRMLAGTLKRPGALLILIICLGLAVRLYAAWEMNAEKPDTPARLHADEPGYDALARGLLAGEGLTWPGRVPLYPVWVAGLHSVTGYSYAAGIYIQCLVGALAVWLTFLYLRFCLEKAVTYWIGDPNADWGDSYIFDYHALRNWGFSRSKTVQHLLSRAFPLVAFASLFWLRP